MTRLRRASIVIALLAFGPLPAHAGPAVATGTQHVAVLTGAGTIWAWGGNIVGQVGDGSTTTRPLPVLIPIDAVTAIAAGSFNTYALKSDGTVWAWGDNSSGQIGDGTTTARSSPVQVTGLSGVVAIAAGLTHAIALKSDGTVWAWGANSSGQIGDGTTTVRNTPVQVASLGTVVTSIAAHGNNSHAVKNDGTLWSWGANGNGEVGDGTTTSPRTSPVQTSGATGMASAGGGTGFSYGITSTGVLRSWGWGLEGELGNATTTARQLTPVTVSGMSSTSVVRGGTGHAVAAKTDGTVWAWGMNTAGQVGDNTTTNRTVPVPVSGPAGVVAVAAGPTHSVAVSGDGRVWSWGGNPNGLLGDGTLTGKLTPIQISEPGFAWKTSTPRLSAGTGTYSTNPNVTITTLTPGAEIHYTTNGADPTQADPTIASGAVFTVTQTLTLSVRAWAAGLPPSNVARAIYTLKVATPTISPGSGLYSSALNVTITATSGATIFYTTDGSNPTEASLLYTGPLPVATTTFIRAIAFRTGWTPSFIAAAGYTFDYGTLAAPVLTPAPGTVLYGETVAISAAPSATIRYTTNGSTPTDTSAVYTGPLVVTGTTTIYAKAFQPDWTTSAQAGGAYTTKVATPVFSPTSGAYPGSQAITITDVTPGAVIRYTTNGLDPTATDPILVSGATLPMAAYTIKARAFLTGSTPSVIASATYDVSSAAPTWSVTAGFHHSAVLKADRRVWTWGANTDGVLGDDSDGRSTPAIVGGLTDVVVVRSGAFHMLALRADGTVWTWGANSDGQLGADATMFSRSTPAPVSGLSAITAIAAGSFFSVALKSDGTVWTWGDNEYGQLGDGTRGSRATPFLIPELSEVVAIAAGDAHVVARKADGTLWAWGNNEHGQLGVGTTLLRTSPTLVPGLTASAGPWAGYAHTLAGTAAGALWAWGANEAGQLGLGQSGGLYTEPTLVPSLANVTIAAGAGHALAVRADGTVWTWGNNVLGSVGDGSSANRPVPYQIAGLANVADVAAGLNHSLAVTTDGTLWAWGANVNGELGEGTIEEPLPRTPISAPGLLWKTSTPTFWPPTGTYSATTAVTISTVTPAAVIHYTTNGATPTLADPVVASGASVMVDQSLTLKAAAWAPGFAESNVGAAVYTMALPPPVMSPPSGTFEGTVTVSLSSAVAGATIRYTTDGTSPSDSSPIYTSPRTFTTRTTLQARAFRTGWTTSAAAIETYSFFDHVAPVITFNYSAPPNAAGWHNAPVTVSFTCTDDNSGVASCPQPILFESNGAGQMLTVTAYDVAGNAGTRTVTVNLDRTAPEVALGSPSDGMTTEATTVTVSATVADFLSGVTSAKCNGTAATLAAGTITCTVPLQKGLNLVVAQAFDAAGNNASASARVNRVGTPSSIAVVPSRYTLAAGDTRALKVVDDFGRPVTSLTWNSDNATIATVDDEGVVTAVSDGQATITASTGSLLTQVSVTILAAGPMPSGTTRWSVDPVPGFQTIGMVGVGPTADDFTSFVAAERAVGGASILIRGLNTAGEQTHLVAPPLAAGEQASLKMGDADGGVLLTAGTSSLAHINVHTGQAGWRYSAGEGATIGEAAQGPDGTMFVLVNRTETPAPAPYTSFSRASIVGLDGQTGTVKFEIAAPRSRVQTDYTGLGCAGGGASHAWSDVVSALLGPSIKIDTDGRANVVVMVNDAVEARHGELFGPCNLVTRSATSQVLLFRVSSSGAYTTTVLHESADGAVSVTTGDGYGPLPDDQGGVLVPWWCSGPGQNCGGWRAQYVGPTTTGAQYPLTIKPVISGSNQVGYGYDQADADHHTFKFDMTNGSVAWTSPVAGGPAAALEGGQVAVTSNAGVTSIIATDGKVVTTGLPGFAPLNTVDDHWIGQMNGMVHAVAGPGVGLDVSAGSPAIEGNRGDQNAPPVFYKDMDTAALVALNEMWPLATSRLLESGAQICHYSRGYVRGQIKIGVKDPNGSQSTNLAGEHCNPPFGSTVAFAHTHPNVSVHEWSVPSGYMSLTDYLRQLGSDLRSADMQTEKVNYLLAPNFVDWPVRPIPPSGPTHFLKYQGPQSKTNISEYDVPGGTWYHFPNAPW